MKTLVIGSAGGFGGEVARELIRRGHAVRALARPGGSAPDLLGAEVVEGDALDADALDRAATGVDAIVWGFHLPYTQWIPGAIDSARITADVAARHGAVVLVPGNVYGLGVGDESGEKMDERAPKRPRSRLGEIRNEIESIFEEAAARGARVVIVRAGDYIGGRAANSWLSIMTARAKAGGKLIDMGKPGVPHAWAYLPDLARAGVLLLEKSRDPSGFAPFEAFHFEGYTLDPAAMMDAVRRAIGDDARGVRRFPWWLLQAASPFSAMVRSILSMRYLWDEPVILDGAKLRAALPDFSVTPLVDALRDAMGAATAPRLAAHTASVKHAAASAHAATASAVH